ILHPAFFPFFGPARYTTDDSEEALAAVKAASQVRVDHYYSHLEKHLDGREFIAGNKRSVADAYAVPMLRWGRLLEKPLSDYPALNSYLERMEADNGVQRAMKEQGLVR
ncbi:MAG: glutathione binding-like protein, partial [Pseudomonadota bacterium]